MQHLCSNAQNWNKSIKAFASESLDSGVVDNGGKGELFFGKDKRCWLERSRHTREIWTLRHSLGNHPLRYNDECER